MIRDELLEIIGYTAEVCLPDERPIMAFYTDRHLSPILERLVEYVEAQRAEERLRTQGIIEELENHIDYLPGHTRAELRAVVETLPIILYPIPDEKWGAVTGHAVDRGDVLALLDGSNNDQGELIQACNDAFVWANEGEIESVLDVAEPLIRRDEARRMNERWRTQVLDNERWQMRLDVLADLRAQVEALRDEAGRNEHASDLANYTTATFEYQAEREVLDKVLALIDGSNDGQG